MRYTYASERRAYRSARRSLRASHPVLQRLRWLWLAPMYLSTALHETAHTLVASALGGRVRLVRIGSGRIVRVFRIAGRRVELRTPANANVGGLAVVVGRPARAYLDDFLATSAGPFVTVAWLVAVGWLLAPLPLWAWGLVMWHYAKAELAGCRGDARRVLHILSLARSQSSVATSHTPASATEAP